MLGDRQNRNAELCIWGGMENTQSEALAGNTLKIVTLVLELNSNTMAISHSYIFRTETRRLSSKSMNFPEVDSSCIVC